jgi:hypothetical protein
VLIRELTISWVLVFSLGRFFHIYNERMSLLLRSMTKNSFFATHPSEMAYF